jgi:serine/threonine-protein kinase
MLQQLRRVRHALDHGVADDQELTDDLTPTVAVGSGLLVTSGAAAGSLGVGYGGSEARTVAVGLPGGSGESTVEEPTGEASNMPPPRPGTGVRRRRRRGRWVAMAVVLAVAAAVGATVWYYGVGRYQTTPNVVGMTQSAAAAKLRAGGLALAVTRTAYSETVPDGDLISTDPGPGQHVAKGGTVDAVISKGPERHDVPDLTGLTQAQALAAVHQRFLTVATPLAHAWSGSVPRGDVVSFLPKADTPLRRGGLVHLVISRGPEPIDIPDFVHKNAADARSSLTGLGFRVTDVKAYDDTVRAGDVVSQTPASGTGYRGDRIRIVVSRGPHLVQVPDVNHNGTSAAQEALQGAGFHVEVKQYTPSFGLGFVVSQSPGGGAMAPYGSTVTIYIV